MILNERISHLPSCSVHQCLPDPVVRAIGETPCCEIVRNRLELPLYHLQLLFFNQFGNGRTPRINITYTMLLLHHSVCPPRGLHVTLLYHFSDLYHGSDCNVGRCVIQYVGLKVIVDESTYETSVTVSKAYLQANRCYLPLSDFFQSPGSTTRRHSDRSILNRGAAGYES